MAGVIYLKRKDGGNLVEMNETPYKKEDILQRFISEYPYLLVGDQIDPEDPRRWILVKNEATVPDEVGDNRLSLDHLLLDQDGIPTLVEVKRSSDPRIRREVVGQMLDYASNAVIYWPVETLRRWFEEQCGHERRNPALVLAQLLNPSLSGSSPDDQAPQNAFWANVNANLKAGRVRLLFVADEIPPMLRRMVQFLNAQMDPADVLAIEVKQYVDRSGEHVTIVPRLLGQSERKVRQTGGKCTEADFEAGIRRTGDDYWEAVQDFRKKVEKLKGRFVPFKNSMGAYFRFKDNVGALVHIPCEGGVLHPASKERLGEYVSWGYFTPEAYKDYLERFSKFSEEFKKNIQAYDRRSDVTGYLDAQTYRAFLDMLVEWYEQHVKPKISRA